MANISQGTTDTAQEQPQEEAIHPIRPLRLRRPDPHAIRVLLPHRHPPVVVADRDSRQCQPQRRRVFRRELGLAQRRGGRRNVRLHGQRRAGPSGPLSGLCTGK